MIRLCYILILSLFLLTGCNTIKFIPENRQLFEGAEVVVQSDSIGDKEARNLKESLKEEIRPRPNDKSFNTWRTRLWIHYKTKDKKWKVWKRINNRYGEEPVFYRQSYISSNEKIILNRLENRGYFDATLTSEKMDDGKRATIIFTVNPGSVYTIQSIDYPVPDTPLKKRIAEEKENKIIQVGNPYNLGQLREERSRIIDYLKEEGYYYFDDAHLTFRADTNALEKTVRLRLRLQDDVPKKALQKYSIGKVYIYPDFDLTKQSDSDMDTIPFDDYLFVENQMTYRYDKLLKSISLKPGAKYSGARHTHTIKKLMSLRNFNFVNIRYEEAGDSLLDAKLFITPMLRRSIRGEFEGVSKSNNFVGPRATVSLQNRNLLRGAEILKWNIEGGFETQVTRGRESGLNSHEVGTNLELIIPRIPWSKTSEEQFRKQLDLATQSKIQTGYKLQNRIGFFSMNNINADYELRWNYDNKVIHQFTPLSISNTSLWNTSDEFDEVLDRNVALRRSFREQFIIGSQYQFSVNHTVNPKFSQFFRAFVDVAGNSLQFTQRQLLGMTNDQERIVGQIYSQFVKLEMEWRSGFKLGEKSKIASRLIAGAGYAFGNSENLPYIKQFFIGGTNSLRAFPARAVGPGTYRPESLSGVFFFDQTGDIKLEGNLEYRFDIIAFLKGAFFADAGNIWVFRENPENPGGQFKTDEFYRQIALGTGFGLRFDFDVVVVRTDLAFPLHVPYFPEGERWIADQVDFFNSDWRGDNLILNIAIGYPF